MMSGFYETKESRKRKMQREKNEIYGYEMEKEWIYCEDDVYVVESGNRVG